MNSENLITMLPVIAIVLALILAFLIVRRGGDGDSTVNLAKMNQALNEIYIKHGDLANNVLVENNKRFQEMQKLHSRIARIEDFLLEMSCGTGEKRSFAEACEKKKTVSDDDAPTASILGATVDKLKGFVKKDASFEESERADVGNVATRAPTFSPPPISAISTIRSGLRKTRDKIFAGLSNLFDTTNALDAEFYEGLEGVLISNDLGVSTASTVIETVKKRAAVGEAMNGERVVGILKEVIADILSSKSKDFYALNDAISRKNPAIILMVGVNGVGKTTTVGKFASYFSDREQKVLIVAADTFRAAAVDQLQIWGQRSNVTVVYDEHGRKPGAVVFDAIKKMKNGKYDVMLIDTAGRLNNKTNLMSELKALGDLIKREHPGALLEVVLVVDAATGQNALQQARDFNQAVGVHSMVVTKLDGTSKGGIVVAIKRELGIPIRFVGVGEQLEDLKPFSVGDFVEGLVTPENEDGTYGTDDNGDWGSDYGNSNNLASNHGPSWQETVSDKDDDDDTNNVEPRRAIRRPV